MSFRWHLKGRCALGVKAAAAAADVGYPLAFLRGVAF